MNTISTAFNEYFRRPADERKASVNDLILSAQTQKDHSFEREYSFSDLGFVEAENGLAMQSPKGNAALTNWAFGQLCRMIGAPAKFMGEIPASMAVPALNWALNRTAKESDSDKKLNILLQSPNGNPVPQIRSVNSAKYGRYWDADFYTMIKKTIMSDAKWALPPTWTGETAGAYRGDRNSFLILVDGGSIVEDPSKRGNESTMYKALMFRNSEVGESSVSITEILFRFICGNHMLWGALVDNDFKRRHKGTKVAASVEDQMLSITARWNDQNLDRDNLIIKSLIDNEIASTKEDVITKLRSYGFQKNEAEDSIKLCEEFENVSPLSYWGVVQGATRLSQQSKYQDERFTLDKLASDLLVKGRQLVMA